MKRFSATFRLPVRGMTLVELMVVIVIVAIMASLTVPAYSNLLTQNRMSAELNDLQSDLELARSSAIREGMAVTICPSTNPTASTPTCSSSTSWSTGWIVFSDTYSTNGNQTYTPGSGDVLMKTHGPFNGSDSAIINSTGSSGGTPTLPAITFNRLGGTASFGTNTTQSVLGKINLNDAKASAFMKRCLVISQAGTLTPYAPQNSLTRNAIASTCS